MNLRTRARKLFGRELSEHTVKATRVDHAVLHDVRKRAQALDDAITTPPRLPNDEALDGKVWERLTEDLWSEFYGDDEPELRSRDKVDPRFQVNRQLADKQARDEDFRDLRSMTRGEVTESALGLLGALGSLRESYGDELAEHAERQNEIADKQDEIDHMDEFMEHLRELRREGDPGGMTTEEIDDEMRSAAERKRVAVDGLKGTVAQQAQHAGDLIDAAKKVTAQAAEAAEEAIEVASLLPGKGPGPGKRVSIDQMLAFADRVNGNPVLQQVLEMLGRLELSMGNTRRQMRKGGFEELVDIELGNELAAVLPAEKALLTHPVARMDFYRRYHERSLMQYEYESELELKRGPIIFAADGSGSMSGAPNVFARGLTLAACSIGNREGRNTAAVEFSSSGEIREFFFPKECPLDTATALDFAEHFYAGGTDINQVLRYARELIANEEPFHTADLVLVTDGGDVLTDESYTLRDELIAAGVTIHGLQIGAQPTQYLLTVCNAVSSVLDFAGPNSTSDRLAIDLT